MGPIGWPAPSCMPASMSSMLASSRPSMASACAMYGTSSRFTTKPGVSLHAIGCLPSRLANAKVASNTSPRVLSVRTTSTSFISCTGLKKCSPTNWSSRLVDTAISPIGSDDVLEANTVFASHTPSSSENSLCFVSMFSTIASTTRSQSRSADSSDEPWMRPSVAFTSASTSASLIPVFAAFFVMSFCTDLLIAASPLSTAAGATSTATTSSPCSAACCAIP
mmetsp:Transcript_31304/g.101938  ORF Transcript_31304/g.101938 Transcript_31304/m.101938 type:complete len:222 (+) Transcript_31304:133-798(+)